VKPRVLTITSSDTRSAAGASAGGANGGGDASGMALRALLAPHADLLPHEVLGEDAGVLGARLDEARRRGDARVIVITGGTGIAPRDRTIEEVTPRLDKVLDGFGEAFRRLSFDQIGARAILSRALAGVMGETLIFALPGSTRAVELAVTELVVPVLGHAVDLIEGKTQHHHRHHGDR
jgi:molybdopterin adenylyltransferase